MKPRFRVRTRDGRELEPQNLEVLAELIRSGSVRPEDLVFDALTSEWAPARAHSVVRMFSHGDAEPESETPPEVAAVASAPGASDLGFTLVEPQEAPSDEETDGFIARLEHERRRDEDVGASPASPETPLLADSGVVEGLAVPIAALAPSEPIPANVPEPDPVATPDAGHPRGLRGVGTGDVGPGAREPSARPVPPTRRKSRWSVWLRESWTLAAVLPLVAVAGSAALARPAAPVSSEVTPQASNEEPVRSTSRRLLPQGEAGIRQRAHERFLEALNDLGTEFDVEAVPPDWLEGWYLAHPSSYPEVRDFWERFLDYAEEAYATEVLLYREAYLGEAADAGMNGPVRSLRMAAAVDDFEAGRGEREADYARVWDLAISSLALHDQLVQVEGRITYEPARGQRLSADPVLEAAGKDPEAQGRLEVALDRVLRDLRGPDGTGVRDRSLVASWLVDGFRLTGPEGG